MASIVPGLLGPCKVDRSKPCPAATDPRPSPRPIRFGDYVTWTTAVDWGQPGDAATASSGRVNVIEMSSSYPIQQSNVGKVGISRIDCPTQVATSAGRRAYPPQGRWRIVPVDKSNMGKICHYNDPRTCCLLFIGNGCTNNKFHVGQYNG